ncbi:LIM domain kinase 1 isoform X2 [Maniola hyperantus]|uniref:LIM domain kinase 1 isoform X2 n=1 Tax=Aphantopus hyperantus TaxID=2795564 RepID=UPI002131FEE8
MESQNSREILSCASCLNDIGDEDYVSALGQDWHKDCFRCSDCDAQLTTWYFEKDGMLFCQADYWARFGDNCQQCRQVITGPVMAAGEHRFHPECFACTACGAHLEDTEPYALLDRAQLYCGACYESGGVGRTQRDAHAIRVLRAPAHALRLAPAHCGALLVHHIDSRCGLLTLHIGDKVLEVNGSPVGNTPLAEIERVLARPEIIQLTIEHNPDTINAKRGTSHLHTQSEDERLKNESTPPVERKLLRDDSNQHIPNTHSNEERSPEELVVRKERLFKRKGEDGGKTRVIKRRQVPLSPLLGEKERSSSMSKLLDVVDGEEPSGVLGDLSRARSFRAEPAPGQKVFRASDLIQGELLGTGFFGQVYKVTVRATGEEMVLKQLYRVDEEAQRNFLKEVAVLRSLRHRCVLRFAGVLYRDRRLHLVTEYIAGGTLHALLQDGSRALRWCERVRLARDVAAGVGYLHRMNVIHRDLNSHNCLIRPGEELSVVVADFGLARIVQRTASSAPPHASLRRKRYTVVGNPYWMAPEMMNGKLYDEKVDVFSFGIILCEIIGRVSADPDFLPRRSDFGLNERAFLDKFCASCPEPFYRLAFLACHLDPDARPPFEVIEIWLQSLVMHLSNPGPLPPTLLADILQYGHGAANRGHATPECCQHTADNGIFCVNDVQCCQCTDIRRTNSKAGSDWATQGVVKSQSNATLDSTTLLRSDEGGGGAGRRQGGRALGKCVSASHLAPRRVTLTPAPRRLSKSTHALAPGYILRADGDGINITRVDDISEWLEPPALKRSSPDAHLNHLPAFLRHQSADGLQASAAPLRRDDSDSSSDDDAACGAQLADMVRRGGHLLAQRASYDLADVTLRRDAGGGAADVDCKRFNIDYHTRSRAAAEAVENIPKTLQPKPEKPNFFAKKLLSPKLSRLFKPNIAEAVRKPETDDKEDKSRSKFFIQRPTSPGLTRSAYRVRPADDEKKPNVNQNVLKSDVKLASMGKPMTPIFRRHVPSEKCDFADVRFSCRERRFEPKSHDKSEARARLKANPTGAVEKKLGRSAPNAATLTPVLEKRDKTLEKDKEEKGLPKKREIGISRSNYVNIANLRISKELGQSGRRKAGGAHHENLPVERVI